MYVILSNMRIDLDSTSSRRGIFLTTLTIIMMKATISFLLTTICLVILFHLYLTRQEEVLRDGAVTSFPAKVEKLTAAHVRTVVALHISEGMTMAMANTYKLARIATEWGANTVLPFLEGKGLTGIPATGNSAIDLLYNSSQLSVIGKKHGILPFIDFEYFMKHSDRRNLYFFYLNYRGRHGRKFEGKAIVQCSNVELSAYESAIVSLNKEARSRGQREFHTRQEHCCTVQPSQGIVPEDFLTGCNITTTGSFAILIDEWRGYYAPSYESKISFARLYVPDYVNRTKTPDSATSYPYSRLIQDSTREFVKQLTNNEDFIGVHIRAERLQIQNREHKKFNDQKCIQDLVEKVAEVSKRHSDIKHIIYIADNSVERYTQLLPNVTISRFVPSQPKLQVSSFIAQVEQNTLSQAKELIMCGGGTFERSTSQRFKENRPEGKFHVIHNCGRI